LKTLSVRNLLTASLALACSDALRAEPPAAEALEFFERKIRPVLIAECVECHGAAKQKGGLRVDFRDGLRKGGETAPAVVPGDAAKSLLLSAIKHLDPDLKMPAKAPKLDDAVIADFEKWIATGAADPRDAAPLQDAVAESAKPTWEQLLAARKGWWSLQPVRKTDPPAVQNAAWSDHPVDRFLLAKMEEQRLAPSADADPRTAIRRLTYALVGLPPTPEEAEAFEIAATKDRKSAIADATARLLASPRFGEHWARHWMDLFRYADTHGSEGDAELPEAWRYRDYLIRAFNADVPLDALIREHLAGDLLEAPRWNREEEFNESILGIAQLRMVEHGYQPVDTLDEQNKVVDNQMDVVMKAFQGLTVTCARCHDHKFDAISQRDYYAIYGVFASCRPAMVTIDSPERLATNAAELAALKPRIKTALADAWLAEAAQFPARLIEHDGRIASATRLREAVAKSEAEIAAIEAGVRTRLVAEAGAGSAQKLPRPVSRWSFEADARDELGQLHGHLEKGALVRGGRLVLNGTGAFVRTEPLPREIAAKTFEVWVSPANLTQSGGGVMALQNRGGGIFDSLVFAERDRAQWVAGSDFFRRSKQLGAPAETAEPGELVHLAVAYQPDGRVAVFRNGVAYGAEYRASGEGAALQRFAPNDAHLLFGLRHTGGGMGFFAGEIEEARLYDRPLTTDEVRASFRNGPASVGLSPEEVAKAFTEDERARTAALRDAVANARKENEEFARDLHVQAALAAAAADARDPLHAWVKLRALPPEGIAAAWAALHLPAASGASVAPLATQGAAQPGWNLAGQDAAECFRYGTAFSPVAGRQPSGPGEFSLLPEGGAVLTGLRPGAIVTDALSRKHNAVLATPRFKVASNFISVRAWGGGGARVRLIVDGYPIGSGGLFPAAALDKDEPGWIRLDVKYRRGSMAYLEFATANDLTRYEPRPEPAERSWFGVERIVFHDTPAVPLDPPSALLFAGAAAPQNGAELASRFGEVLRSAITAWRAGSLDETQRLLLDHFVRRKLLPMEIDQLPAARDLIAEYRRLESEIPAPRRAPGVVEADSYDAALLVRGEHTKPADAVPRSFLAVFGSAPFFPPAAEAAVKQRSPSGRRELAEAIASPQNPLTARVLVNRLWHWTYGRGLVATPDNFGRMGEKPTHPELLDALATQLVEQRWSAKEMIRFLVTARVFGLSSQGTPDAHQRDPANAFLSYARIRRLEAEPIRDALLAVSGWLDPGMFGPGADLQKSLDRRLRRSVYHTIRRTNLSSFLTVFDAPKPFSTLGRRDATNVPAQSLTLLNDPFVIEVAGGWARAEQARATPDAATRIRGMFVRAFARHPTDEELATSLAYLDQHPAAAGLSAERRLTEHRLWADFAQSLFNLKEFIYLR